MIVFIKTKLIFEKLKVEKILKNYFLQFKVLFSNTYPPLSLLYVNFGLNFEKEKKKKTENGHS